ncbi:MAG TPA: hypothetical protein VKZ70_08875 [Burkholderiaceae bacterium]|nr:hypothetical protein [Burkholderiaceae bacterium]
MTNMLGRISLTAVLLGACIPVGAQGVASSSTRTVPSAEDEPRPQQFEHPSLNTPGSSRMQSPGSEGIQRRGMQNIHRDGQFERHVGPGQTERPRPAPSLERQPLPSDLDRRVDKLPDRRAREHGR